MPETRTTHPYFMYDAMQAQPETWSRVVARARDEARQLAEQMKDVRRMFLVGTGTSYHAALTGENILRAYGPAIGYRAFSAFDFALYGPPLESSEAVVVISHRGTKSYSVKSLERAHGAGAHTILVTGEGPHAVPTPGLVDYVFVGSPQELSSAHTFSYTASVAILSTLAQQLGRTGAGNQLSDEMLTREIPQAIRAALGTEAQVKELAGAAAGARAIRLVGGGPAAIAAMEAALKIRETSFAQAEGMPTETMIHGPFQASESNDLFILIAPQGPARPRTLELAGMIQDIGAQYIVLSDGPGQEAERNALGWIQVPSVPEPFSTLVDLVPLQLFAYHLALARGRNPDIFRSDDERFARASARIKL